MKPSRVIIVEPAGVVAIGLATMLERSAKVEVVANVRTLADIPSACDADVAIVAVGLCRAAETHEALSGMPIIGLLTALSEPEAVKNLVATISIYSSEEEILRAVQEAIDAPVGHNYAESHDLSERERDVLVLVAKGYTNKEIATELFISPHTVISHRKNIVHKTGIRSVAGLTVYAVLNKLIDSEIL